MSEEQTPSVEEIKERLNVEIPVEEEEISKKEAQQTDVAAELKSLGRQFAETLQRAWNSQERQRMEAEVREGIKSFADEVDRVIRETRDSEKTARLREEAEEARTRIESSEVTHRARSSFVQGLHWLSEELARLADQFTLPEKEVADADAEASETTE